MVCFDDFKKYIGIPYKKHGSSFGGCDCYGLVRLVYSTELNIKLPDYYYTSPEDRAGVVTAIDKNIQDWQRIADPAPFESVILININGWPLHMGFIISETEMLHTLRGHNTALETFTRYKWVTRIEGFYKWK